MLILLIISVCPLWSHSENYELRATDMPVQENNITLLSSDFTAVRADKEVADGYRREG